MKNHRKEGSNAGLGHNHWFDKSRSYLQNQVGTQEVKKKAGKQIQQGAGIGKVRVN